MTAAGATAVLDTSAVLAWLRNEPGADLVHPLLPAAVMSAANWSETWQKLHQHGVDAARATHRLRTLGVRVEPVTEADAVRAATLWTRTRTAGLSLGDRCCLALGARLDLPAVTADTAWAGLDLDVAVRIIR
ncbi:MAG TPA: type II toxin-antitoxin system VapC family toxin [Pseudonocardiaceae bacterium]